MNGYVLPPRVPRGYPFSFLPAPTHTPSEIHRRRGVWPTSLAGGKTPGSDNAEGEETAQDIESAMPSTPESTATVAANVDNSSDGIFEGENAPD